VKVVLSRVEKGHGVTRIERGCYGCVHRPWGRDGGNLAMLCCFDQMRMESAMILVVRLASRGDECQLMCGVERGS
jgi:hypothetical protein